MTGSNAQLQWFVIGHMLPYLTPACAVPDTYFHMLPYLTGATCTVQELSAGATMGCLYYYGVTLYTQLSEFRKKCSAVIFRHA